MKVRTGTANAAKTSRKSVNAADVKAIVQTAQNASNVPALRQAVADLATLVGQLAEAVGLQPKTK